MKKIYLFLVLFLISLVGKAQNVNIPDATFKTLLLNYQPTIDTNSDGEIQVSEALLLTDLTVTNSYITDLTGIGSFSNLLTLNCSNNYQVNSLDLSALTNLQTLDCSRINQLSSLDLSALTNLQTLDCSRNSQLSSLNLTGLTNLQNLNCSHSNNLTTFDVSNLSSLQNLDCSSCNLTGLNVSNLSSLLTLNCDANFITVLNTNGANNISHLNCSNNRLLNLTVSNMTNLSYLNCGMMQSSVYYTGISNLNLTGLTNLTYLVCPFNNLTALDVNNLINLVTLNCSFNNIYTLNVSNLINLTSLNCTSNGLSSLDVSPLINLEYLTCSSNSLNSLNIDSLVNLKSLYCDSNMISTINLSNQLNLIDFFCPGNQLTSLSISNLHNLKYLDCSHNQLTSLSISNLHNLKYLDCSHNQLTTLNVSNLEFLTTIIVSGNLFTTLDFSTTGLSYQNLTNSPYPIYYQLGNPTLTYVNLKNGINISSISVTYSPNLQYICADEQNIQYIQQQLQNNNLTTVQVNSYCSFVPGGIHNTITGVGILDINNNGCDTNDLHPKDLKVTIDDGTVSGATFTNTNGGYSFYTSSGNFVLTPQFQNPFFTVNPVTTTLNFPLLDGSTQTQDFCITSNGVHNDLDITILPLDNARPGFDAHYKLIYKNKGNQTLSGAINFSFDDSILDFVSAMPTVASQSVNNLNWNYSNLNPFESRSIDFTLNVNAPTETPAVNIDDHLIYVATITPISGDETTNDNLYNYDQIVTGSFDPNDKTCLEGETISPSKVGDYLHYIIRFQNSGTAPAENVVVNDMIDASKFDISSLQLTSSSHTQTTKISGNKVEFIFQGINLPYESLNEPASHGYVAFKIKTKNNLVLGNTISNTANIYFDYNFPIVTNTATTTVATLSNAEFENNSVAVFPNPIKNIVNVTSKDAIKSIALYDAQGRLIETKLSSSTEAKLDISDKQSGIYFIKVYTENGVKIEKIIKE